LKQLKCKHIQKSKIILNDKLLINSDYKFKLINIKLDSNLIKNEIFFKNNITNYNIDTFLSLEDTTFFISYLSDILNNDFFISKFNSFDSYLTTIELSELSKNRFIYKYKYSLITLFLPFFIKNGKKLFAINNVLNALSNIYLCLNNEKLFSDYAFVNEFKYYILNSTNTKNISYILN
jgi:hypothetical protein